MPSLLLRIPDIRVTRRLAEFREHLFPARPRWFLPRPAQSHKPTIPETGGKPWPPHLRPTVRATTASNGETGSALRKKPLAAADITGATTIGLLWPDQSYSWASASSRCCWKRDA